VVERPLPWVLDRLGPVCEAAGRPHGSWQLPDLEHGALAFEQLSPP
jgi:hypothetical protein